MNKRISGEEIGFAKSCRLLAPLALSFAGAIASANPAQAVQIDFSYGSGITSDQMIGMEIAGGIWESYLTNDTTVNIHVETTDGLSDNVVGGALPGVESDLRYKDFRNVLYANQSSWDDVISTRTLKSQDDELKTVADGYKIEDDNKYINLTRANAKAMGIRDRHDDELDGYILINSLEDSDVDWSYDFLGEEVPDGEVDFVSVALHEIGHSLGFVSGVDSPGWLEALTDAEQGKKGKKDKDKDEDDDEDEDDEDYEDEDYEDEEKDDDKPRKNDRYKKIYKEQDKVTHPYVLDLFRYSPDSRRWGYNDLSIGEKKFFSLDGGLINLADFSTGEGGDGFQASHWKLQDDNPLGIMDPLIRAGQKRNILELDTTVMDVIGWGIDSGEYDVSALLEEATEEVTAIETQDRFEDIDEMIEESQIYRWWWSRNGRGSSSSFGWWQGLMKQHFLWQEVETADNASAESVSVPEPSSAVGLLGLGIGLGWLRKSRKKK